MKIITGASSGIGKFLFDRYGEQEAHVYGTYFTTRSTDINISKVDTASLSDVRDWIHSIPDILLPQDITLLNCAAMNYDAFTHKADPFQWKRTIDVNLIGTFNVIHTVLPLMRVAGWGRIINFSSVVDDFGMVGTSSYAASKAGLTGLTKVLSKENASKGITINNLRLGYFNIGMGARLRPEFREKIKEMIPGNKFGEPEDIFRAVEFLIESEYVNGSTITIDGGLT